MILQKITCYRYSLPLCGGGERQGVLFALENDASRTGWGEASPLPGFSSETLEAVLDASLRFCNEIRGCSVSEIRERMAGNIITSPSLYFSFDSALRQIEIVSDNKATVSIPLCALAAGDDATVHKQVESALNKGYQTIKVKVGAGTIQDDIRKMKGLLRDFTGCFRWRFDANRAWEFEEAMRFCEVIAGDDALDYVEEPLCDFRHLPELQDTVGVPCAVDETLQELSRCLFSDHSLQEEILRHTVEAAQALVWKPSLCMNPKHMHLDTVAPVVLSGAYESGVGTAAILEHAAAALDCGAVGIDTYSRLEQDVLEQRLPVSCGEVSLQAVRDDACRVNTDRLEEVWHV
jgi:o-succinylbenzoate synthase